MHRLCWGGTMPKRNAGEGSSLERNVNAGEGSSSVTEPWKLYISTDHESANGVGFGGLIVDGNGNWVRGFMGKFGLDYYELEVELKAIYHGLVLLNEIGYKGAKIYLSEYAANAIRSYYDTDYPDRSRADIYIRCSELWASTGCTELCHDPPQTTSTYAMAAQWLAQRGATGDGIYRTLLAPPSDMPNLD